jgi:hypothetical protein
VKLERNFLFVQDDGDALGAGRIDCAVEFENHVWEKCISDIEVGEHTGFYLPLEVDLKLHLMTKTRQIRCTSSTRSSVSREASEASVTGLPAVGHGRLAASHAPDGRVMRDFWRKFRGGSGPSIE